MEQDKVRVRYCAMENCTVRMSSVEKDRHVLCPSHTGWQCTWDRRCAVCKEWPDTQMKAYVKLQDGKGRKKAHKERRKAAKLAAGLTADDRGNAHSLSPSPSSYSSSQSEIGEPVPSPFVGKPDVRLGASGSNLVSVNLGGGIDIVSDKIVACSPSALPPTVGDSGYLGQVW